MARNAEKAMTTLARWRAHQLQEQGKGVPEQRPHLASNCHNLRKAEKFRMQVIRDVAKKVAQIQNAGLGEFRIRDLNDEINKLLREKGHWEARIKELGGPDYAVVGPKMLDHEGREVPGNKGYKYFGAAKDLPGVRDLFQQEPPQAPRKTRAELMREIDADYYGYRDDDDGVLIALEVAKEKLLIAEAIKKWKEEKSQNGEDKETAASQDKEDENFYNVEQEPMSDDEDTDELLEGGRLRFIAHVPVPSQKEVEMALVERRKKELLNMYSSEGLQKEEEEAKKLLGL